MIHYLKVCSKRTKTKDGKVFDAMFAYRQTENEGVMTDILTPSTDKDGNPTMIAKSLRVALTDEAKRKLIADNKFPYLLTLEDGLDENRKPTGTKADFYVTRDKDKDGVVRLDKYGKSHPIAVIANYRSAIHVEPLNTMTLDDIDDFE